MFNGRIRNCILLFLILFVGGARSTVAQQLVDEEEGLVGIISGHVLLENNTPFSSGFVAFFNSDEGPPQDYGSASRKPKTIAYIGDNGQFDAQLPAGPYYLGAMMRQKDERMGPPRSDEKRFSAIDEQGNYSIFLVKGGQHVDIGKVTVREPQEFPEISHYFTIQGKVMDEYGNPFPVAAVGARISPSSLSADYLSPETDEKGNYRLRLPPGRYYLVALAYLSKEKVEPGNSLRGVYRIEPVTGPGAPIYDLSQEDISPVIGKEGDIVKDINVTIITGRTPSNNQGKKYAPMAD